MKDKTSTLTGEKLAYWTARAQRWEIDTDEITGWDFYYDDGFPVIQVDNYHPDINAGKAMELAEKFNVSLEVYENDSILAHIYMKHTQSGMKGDEEKLICRAVVDFVFGEEVDDGT